VCFLKLKIAHIAAYQKLVTFTMELPRGKEKKN